MPSRWSRESGWTRYDADGSYDHIAHPPAGALTFDVETLYKLSPFGVMACAADADAWYAWVSPWLLGETEEKVQLIPMPARDGAEPRIVVGHNVGYDRARIADEYDVGRTGNRFMDTMSLHVAVHGLSSPQRPAWMKHRKKARGSGGNKVDATTAAEDADLENGELAAIDLRSTDLPWMEVSSVNSLAEVAQLHLGIEMDKTARDRFGSDATRESVLDSFDELMTYCATDVRITHAVFAALLPAFLQQCPSPVTFAALLHMGSSFLPVDESWPRFIANADAKYDELTGQVVRRLRDLAEDARKLIAAPSVNGRFAYDDDPWLRQLDWSPKRAKRGVVDPVALDQAAPAEVSGLDSQPQWLVDLEHDGEGRPVVAVTSKLAPLLLRMSWAGHPLTFVDGGWQYIEGAATVNISDHLTPAKRGTKVTKILGAATFRRRTELASPHVDVAPEKADAAWKGEVEAVLTRLALEVAAMSAAAVERDPWLAQLDWTHVSRQAQTKAATGDLLWPKWYHELWKPDKVDKTPQLHLTVRSRIAPLLFKLRWRGYPLVYTRQHGWTFCVAADEVTRVQGATAEAVLNEPVEVDATVEVEPVRETNYAFAPLVAANSKPKSTPGAAKPRGRSAKATLSSAPHTHFWQALAPLTFDRPEFQSDMTFETERLGGALFFRVPHISGEPINVGNVLSKGFIGAFEDGRLTADLDGAKEALAMNAQCSYWTGVRARCVEQLVVWQDPKRSLGLPDVGPRSIAPFSPAHELSPPGRLGLILPQVITMGTVTRRAVEKTWLTASNAKKNRVGSEVKAMVRAPPGYAIVGADVDSEELWVASVMGDAQFGLHGATALGWQTLEGTKSAGTDMHSATASKIGVSRDEAKVFNYSRIYGAGVKHATNLLVKANPTLPVDEAAARAKTLYAATKGQRAPKSVFDSRFWHGGSESYVFNKLEGIAMSDEPRTPTLGCGVTAALAKARLPADSVNFNAGEGYLPSRINWVVQSSGVDYLHLLVVAMEYLIRRHGLRARYMISVHDEIRYLVDERDKYRVALALQVSNLWTRALFAYRLQMDDLPQVRIATALEMC